MPPAPEAAQAQIPFAPLPVRTVVGSLDTIEEDGTMAPRIFVQITTPFGVNGIVLSPEHADTLARQLATAVRMKRSGLVLPPGAGAGLGTGGPDVSELEEALGLDQRDVDETELGEHPPLEPDRVDEEELAGGEGGAGGGA